VQYAPLVVERLDEERLETLRAWGEGLSTSARDELRAAGKAILMLVDEIDRLEADLWNARAAATQAVAAAAAAEAAAARATAADEPLPALAQRPTAEPPARDRQSPAAQPSQVLALTLSERIAQGRPTEPAT
jgi:septal ring factor EnvC (AmiA/AmiB activator)